MYIPTFSQDGGITRQLKFVKCGSLMSQRDNVYNKEIGEQSLKVTHHGMVASANMHTIAVVTLLFLPGTFVAVSQL
jgi:hypothetical protein